MKLKKHDCDLLAAVESTDKKLVHLFRRAARRGTSKLETLLAADAVSRDDGQVTYHCMARDQFIHGQNHLEAERVAAGDARPRDYQFFGNPLIVDPKGSGKEWASPSSRATLGRHLIYTFEFDHNDPAFLLEQCRWAMPLKEWWKSQFGKLFRDLKQFGDFRLMNVTYSGGKSLHIHLVFETALMMDRAKTEVSPAAVRAGYRAHWLRLHDAVMEHLRPSGGITPDDTLATSTALRRTPNGHRIVGDEHPLGLTSGTKVRQVVLWEQGVERNAAEPVFHSPSLFTAKPMQAKRGGGSTRRTLLTDAQLTYAESWLQDFYNGTGVLLAGIELTNNGYVARFHNSAADGHPASMLTEAFVTPVLRGRGAASVGPIRPLPLTFGQMLDHLVSELDEAKGFDPAALDIVRHRLASFVPYWIVGNGMSLIHAGEGVGKSTSIMRHIDLSLATGRRGQPSMFAFSTYTDAALKAQEFNSGRASASDGPSDTEFVGVEWRSFSRLYSDMAKGAELLTVDDADEADVTLWSLIQMRQPDVARAMREELGQIWRKIEGRTAVLFTVHDVAHQWADNTFTRRMLCPDFLDDGFDAAASRARTELNWLVHDEVSISTFLDRFNEGQMKWLQGLNASGASVWSSGGSKRQRAVYEKFADKNYGDHAVERGNAQRALRAGLEAFEHVVISDAAEYGFKNHTTTPFACERQSYFVRPRDWWMEGERPVASRIVFLTTEIVPSLIAQNAVRSLVYLRPTTNIGRDVIDGYAARGINAENGPDIAQKYAGTSTWVIANKLEGAKNTVSPFAVRGRNDLADADIVQIVTTFHPHHYRELQALGTWLGRDDLALLAHVDQINQSSGRNRGARNNGASHRVYINLTLFRAIMNTPAVRDELRYIWRLEMDEFQRKNARLRDDRAEDDDWRIA